MLRLSLLAVALVPLTFALAAAQQPTQAQRDAIRASCRSDFIANCSGVQPGGREAFECLQRNLAKLSASCKTAVNAIAAPAAPAAAGPPKATASEAAAPSALTAPPPAAPATAALTATPPAAPATAAPTATPPANATTPAATAMKPTAEQKNAVRAACRSDFVALCYGIKPGGTAALRCLQRNAAQLSEPCRSAMAAVGRESAGAPAAAAPTAPATPTAAPAASPPGYPPLGPVRPILPRRAFAILEICRADQQALCANVPLGGGRVLDCLAANAPHLSPQCYKALAPVTQ
jgi:hypothetical protein